MKTCRICGKKVFSVNEHDECKQCESDYETSCATKGCKNHPLPFSKYCIVCYDEKYPPIFETY